MDIETARALCLTVKGATEETPFDDVTLVYKVMGKMFALLPLDAEEPLLALKCDPELVPDLRDHYLAVEPARHFNKTYWNQIRLESDMPDSQIRHWILHSVDEVLKKLPRKQQEAYRSIPENR
jgi:predicted DNA-binding protein (MmcQ/YjbR family)